MSNNNKKPMFSESTQLLWTCLISSTVFFGLYAMINMFVKQGTTWLGIDLNKWIGIGIFIINLIFILIVLIFYKKKKDLEKSFAEKTLQLEKAMTGMMKDVEFPACSHSPVDLLLGVQRAHTIFLIFPQAFCKRISTIFAT